jgi:antitoxin MazE
MRTHVVPIGNSKGIRIPKPLLQLCQIKTDVNLVVRDKSLVIYPVRTHARAGWAQAFQAMHERGEDRPLIDDRLEFKRDQWKW